MKLSKILQQIDENRHKISEYGDFSDPIKKKINYKLRLDWNYYSNRMEGGTLTKEETRSIMVGNIEVKGKPFKDLAEMNGHDKIVLEVLKMSKGEFRISEKRIKEIHKAIMHEENTTKNTEIGEWKSVANEIINYKNEKIDFTAPSEVAQSIHQLLGKTNAFLDVFFKGKHSQHPIEMISQFHIDYLLIHPFYDGNGRTARILTNILLLACGYPIIIIKDELKKGYYQLLADIQVYGGQADLFAAFIGERVLDTQKIILSALEGKSIDEPDDLDKKILLLERELAVVDPNEEVKTHLNREYFEGILYDWGGDLLKRIIPEIQKFNRFFSMTRHSIEIQNMGVYVQFINENADNVVKQLQSEFKTSKQNFKANELALAFSTSYGTFTKGGLHTFGCNYGFRIKFEYIKYEVYVDIFSGEGPREETKTVEQLLHKPLTESDIDLIVSKLTNAIYEHIDFYTKKNGLR